MNPAFSALYRFELRKLLRSRLTAGVLIAMLLLSVLLFLRDSVYLRDAALAETMRMERALDGHPVDEALMAELSEKISAGDSLSEKSGAAASAQEDDVQTYAVTFAPEDVAYENLFSWLYRYVFLQETDPRRPITAAQLYEQRSAHIREIMESQRLSDGERAYWEALEAQIPKPFVWFYTAGPKNLMSNYMAAITFSMMISGLCLAGVFAGEGERRTDPLLLSAPHGRRTLPAAKLLAGITASLSLSLLLLLAVQLPPLIIFGTDGIGAALQIAKPFFAHPWSLGHLLLVWTGIYLSAALLAGAFTLFLSALIKSSLAVAGIVSAIALLSTFVSVPERYRVLSQLVDLRPAWVIANSNRPDFRLIRIFGHYFTNFETAPVGYLLLSALLFLAAASLWRRRQIGGQ